MTSSKASLNTRQNGLSLHELVQELTRFESKLFGDGAVRVHDVQQDSRRVKLGDLFVARQGEHVDGCSFVDAAVSSGAAAVLAGGELSAVAQLPVPVMRVNDPRRALAFAAEAVQGFPSHRLHVLGITGTNGKTTTVALVERGLTAAGAKPARLGTTGFAFGTVGNESNLTTPEADEISRLMGSVAGSGGTHFIMEVSSHSLDQGRVDALRFETVAFTNLTQDHLDHHGDMTNYEAAKRKLFVDFKPSNAVVNVDNPTGVRIADAAQANYILRVGRKLECDVCPIDVKLDATGIRGKIRANGRLVQLDTRLIGEHNLENLLVAIGIFQAMDVDVQVAVAGLTGDFLVPGRLERCEGPDDDIFVLVDYAHTPDALERALQAVKQFTLASVRCVFGCGGDRDPHKRPKMGSAVGRWADYAIVTNDNPRTERPELIAAAIEPGLREEGARYSVVLDRAIAIEQAILQAKPGDVVLIAGKGHESYQIVGTTKRPFDDREQARRALALRRGQPLHPESHGAWR
jgi:UDP-N-acetylmuramoyl-L-alanyl-D-glutamate--2,6-diaminopimelate ligase